MIPKPLPEFKKGGAIRAADMMAVRNAVQRQRIIPGSNNPISLEETANGSVIKFTAPQDRFLAKTSSAIYARAGDVPGAGTVVLQELDASGNIAATSPAITYDVLNYSAAVGGIPTGKYCWISKDMAGNWWIVSAEC